MWHRTFAVGENEPDDRQWVLAEVMIKPGAEEGFYEPVDDLGDDKMLTAGECRNLADQMGAFALVGAAWPL